MHCTRHNIRLEWFVGIVLLLVVSCGKTSASGIDPAFVQANLLSTVPKLDNSLNIDFDGKVVYLGNRVDTLSLTPGGRGRIVHFWQVKSAPGPNWRVFTHLNGDTEWFNLDNTDMRKGYGPAHWKAGDIIRDEQKFTLDNGWLTRTATMRVGLYRKGDSTIDGRMPIVAGGDKDRRAVVFDFDVLTENRPLHMPTYNIRRASGPITIDGKADEASWKHAPMSPNFSDAEKGPKLGHDTVAQLLWDDDYLYAFIRLSDSDVYSQYKDRDDPLWKQDVIELFIDADRNRTGYIELQVNPHNAHFDAWFPKTRAQKHHFEWNSQMKSAVTIHGTIDNRDDVDVGWDVEIAIPHKDVKGMNPAMDVRTPPKLGDAWRLNIVRGDKPQDKGLAAASWNPIGIGDFHALNRMLTVVFIDSGPRP